MTPGKNSRTHYTAREAADALGVSLDQLQALIKLHIDGVEEDVSKVPITTFQASDLLLLRLLAGQMAETAAS